jgi:hypothetical protein
MYHAACALKSLKPSIARKPLKSEDYCLGNPATKVRN